MMLGQAVPQRRSGIGADDHADEHHHADFNGVHALVLPGISLDAGEVVFIRRRPGQAGAVRDDSQVDGDAQTVACYAKVRERRWPCWNIEASRKSNIIRDSRLSWSGACRV